MYSHRHHFWHGQLSPSVLVQYLTCNEAKRTVSGMSIACCLHCNRSYGSLAHFIVMFEHLYLARNLNSTMFVVVKLFQWIWSWVYSIVIYHQGLAINATKTHWRTQVQQGSLLVVLERHHVKYTSYPVFNCMLYHSASGTCSSLDVIFTNRLVSDSFSELPSNCPSTWFCSMENPPADYIRVTFLIASTKFDFVWYCYEKLRCAILHDVIS